MFTVSFHYRMTSTLTLADLRPKVRTFVEEYAALMKPDRIYICDGSEEEDQALRQQMVDIGRVYRLPKYENWYVELKCSQATFIYARFVAAS